ncbi:MAG: hypothetical protein EB078_11605 [Proteobacteria bacterium]|nr:hypothetical protein [Pseudomonadota bacterium]
MIQQVSVNKERQASSREEGQCGGNSQPSTESADRRRKTPEDSLVTQGFGKRKPKASNATEKGRSQNRRVEFFILE